MLQNEEFLFQLRNDSDFLSALERGNEHFNKYLCFKNVTRLFGSDAAKQKSKAKTEKKVNKSLKGNTNELLNPRFGKFYNQSRNEFDNFQNLSRNAP